jgi:hypothetical protein
MSFYGEHKQLASHRIKNAISRVQSCTRTQATSSWCRDDAARRERNVHKCRNNKRQLCVAVNQRLTPDLKNDERFLVLASGVPPNRRAGFQVPRTTEPSRRLRQG